MSWIWTPGGWVAESRAGSMIHLQHSFHYNPRAPMVILDLVSEYRSPYLLNFPQIARMCVNLKSNTHIPKIYPGAEILRALPTQAHQNCRLSHAVDICQPSSVLPEEQSWWWHGGSAFVLIADSVMFLRLSFSIGKCCILPPALWPSVAHFAPAIIRSVHSEMKNPSSEFPLFFPMVN